MELAGIVATIVLQVAALGVMLLVRHEIRAAELHISALASGWEFPPPPRIAREQLTAPIPLDPKSGRAS